MPHGKAGLGSQIKPLELYRKQTTIRRCEQSDGSGAVWSCSDCTTRPLIPSRGDTHYTLFYSKSTLEEEKFPSPGNQRYPERQQTHFALTLTLKGSVFLIVYVLPSSKLFTSLHKLCLPPIPRLLWLLHFQCCLSYGWYLQETKTFLCIRCSSHYQCAMVKIEQDSECWLWNSSCSFPAVVKLL